MVSNKELAVEGCHYELVREDRYQDMMDYYRDHFIPDEPVGRGIGFVYDEDVEALVESELKFNMSIALVSNNSGKIVGIRMMSLISKSDEPEDTSQLNSYKMKLIEDFLIYLGQLNNVFDHYGVEDAVHFFAIGVHRDYRGRGIGLKLMKAAVELVKNLDIGGVVVTGEGSSNYSKKIYEKLNFDILAEVVFEDYKVDGVTVFQNLGEHTFERLYGKVV